MLTAFNPFTDYDRKSSGHCWGAGDQSLHLRCFGGETTEVITVEKTTYVENQLSTHSNQTDPFKKSSNKKLLFFAEQPFFTE